jgi:cytochrome c oxidase cbb3-type subunit 3
MPAVEGRMRSVLIPLVVGLSVGTALVAAGCEREARRFTEQPPTATADNVVAESPLQPGPKTRAVTIRNTYEENAYAVSQGKWLFNQMNCVGCHAHGGGGMGPPLMDDQWIYGSEPENIFETIVEGRPNGMPSFRGRLSNQQVWQLVAYVRSLSGLVPKDVAGGRDDHMEKKSQEQSTEKKPPRQSFLPPASTHP